MLLTPKQVAARLNCHPSRVSRLCKSGKLPCHRDGYWVRIDENDLREYEVSTKTRPPREKQPQTMSNAEVRAALAIVVGPGRKRTRKATS